MLCARSPSVLKFCELGCHRRVAPRQLLDRHVLRLVVGKAQVPVSAQQCVLGFLQVVDGLVDLIDGFFEAVGCQVVVPRERGLERFEFAFEVRDVNVLRPDQCWYIEPGLFALNRFRRKAVFAQSSNGDLFDSRSACLL